MKEKRGQVFEKKNGLWVARVSYKNSNGKKTAIQKTVKSESEANKALEKLEKGGREEIDAEKMTFNDLADYYEKHYVKPAKFIDDRKVEGMRNYKRIIGFLKIFRAYFGKMKMRQIGYEEIVAFRSHRFTIPTHYKRTRNIATMNREISSLRRIFNIGIRKGWILRNPVNMGEPLIDKSAERRRDRILTLEEEKRLLDACTGKRKHLKSLIILLLDTGARRGETLKLKFSDLDFENRLITFQALNTKTLKTRQVMMTNRVYDELQKLWENSDKNENLNLFSFSDVRKSFEVACREAGIETGRPHGITIHSLRHTAATRLVKGQMPIQMVGRILSHQDPITTYGYLTANDETLREAASIFESVQQQPLTEFQSQFDYVIESELIN
jgi:integrase